MGDDASLLGAELRPLTQI